MHRDAPPGFLEKPISVIVTYGLLMGFMAGALMYGGSSFAASYATRDARRETPLTQRR